MTDLGLLENRFAFAQHLNTQAAFGASRAEIDEVVAHKEAELKEI